MPPIFCHEFGLTLGLYSLSVCSLTSDDWGSQMVLRGRKWQWWQWMTVILPWQCALGLKLETTPVQHKAHRQAKRS